jgi:hypothetical protein
VEKVESYELKSFKPNDRTSGNLKTQNNDIEFDIKWVIVLCISSMLTVRRLSKLLAGTRVHNLMTDRIKLVDSFLPYLLSQVEVKKRGQILNEVDCPGLVSML